jgi:hypothetical protein
VLAERLYQVIIIIPSVIGFFHGYYLQSFFVAFKWWLVGAVVAGLVSIPSWPLFLKDVVPWQPMPSAAPEGEQGEEQRGEEEEEAAAAAEGQGQAGAQGDRRPGKDGKGKGKGGRK